MSCGSVQQVQGSGMNPCCWSYGSMLICCTCCTAVSIVCRKPLPLQAIRSRSAGGTDHGRPRTALELTVQARTAARTHPSAGFSMRSSSRPASVQVTSPEPTEPTTYELASRPVAHQPFKSPRQLTYTSGIRSARPPSAGNDSPEPASSSAVKALVERAKWERHMMSVSVRRLSLIHI